jgi:hypothetical protein
VVTKGIFHPKLEEGKASRKIHDLELNSLYSYSIIRAFKMNMTRNVHGGKRKCIQNFNCKIS